MGKMNTAERVSREMSDNFVFQRSLLAYHAAAQRISGDVLEIGTGAGYGIEVVAPRARQLSIESELTHEPLEEKPVTLAIREVAAGSLKATLDDKYRH